MFNSLKTLGTKGFYSIKAIMETSTKSKEPVVEKIETSTEKIESKNIQNFVKYNTDEIVKNGVVSYVSIKSYENIQPYISITNNPVKTSSNTKNSIMNNYSTFLKKLSIAALFLLLVNFANAQATITSAQNGDWNTGSTWVGGVIPASGDNVIIDNDVTLSSSITVGDLTINSGKTLDVFSNSNTINFNSGSTFTNNGIFSNGNGSVTFSGSGTVAGSSTTTFYNVNVSGPVNFGLYSIINRGLGIYSGGSVNTNAPTYGVGTNSSLNYSTGGTFIVGDEWTGEINPDYITVSPSTTLSFGTINTVRTFSGLYFSLQGNMTLSSVSGGDLHLKCGATQLYNPITTNGRNIVFNKVGAQDLQIYSPTPEVLII